MIRRFTDQLPIWARPEHPVLRYELGTPSRASWQTRYARAFGVVLLGCLLVLGGYVAATRFMRVPAGDNLVESLNNVLFGPLLVLQIVLRIAAVTLTSTTVADEIRRQNWDSLRSTPHGAELTLRARWAAAFYRLRGLMGVVLVLRLVLIFGLLAQLMGFRGMHLDLLMMGINPEVALPVGVMLLALLMTAALLLPFTGVGFDASIGLLISASVQQRTSSTLLQAIYITFRLVVVIVLTVGAITFLNGELVLPDPAAWLVMFLFAAMGDWGLSFLLLGRSGEVWATVPYGIFLGLALVIFALLQAALADRLLLMAVRRAQRKG